MRLGSAIVVTLLLCAGCRGGASGDATPAPRVRTGSEPVRAFIEPDASEAPVIGRGQAGGGTAELVSMHAGGEPDDEVVEICGLSVPVGASILRCKLEVDEQGAKLAELRSLESLLIIHVPSSTSWMEVLDAVSSLPELIGLDIVDAHGLTTLASLRRAPKLEHLSVIELPAVALPSVAELRQLRELELHSTIAEDYRPLGQLTALERLQLMGSDIEDLRQLIGLEQLRWLGLAHTRVDELGPLAAMGFRGTLDISSTPVVDLSPLADVELWALIAEHTGISDVSPLRGQPLGRLWIGDTKVADLQPLARVTTLSNIDLSGTEVESIEAAARWARIERINLRDLELESLAPLGRVGSIGTIDLRGARVPDGELEWFREVHAETRVIGPEY